MLDTSALWDEDSSFPDKIYE